MSQCTLLSFVFSQSSLSELFYNSANCKKLMLMQMILVHININYVQWNAIDYCPIDLFFASFASVCKFTSDSWWPISCVYFCILLWIDCNILVVSSLMNEWNKTFDPGSFYICMRVMIIPLFDFFHVHINYLNILLKHKFWFKVQSRTWESFCKFPGDVHAAGPQMPLRC